MSNGSWISRALVVSAIGALVACGTNPRHLDARLAKQLVTNAVAQQQVSIRITAADPSPKDLPTLPSPALPSASGVDDHDICIMNGASDTAVDDAAIAALVKAGYLLNRYHPTSRCPGFIHVFTPVGKVLSRTWTKNTNNSFTAAIGTGYDIRSIRDIRFAASQGAYYASFTYEAAPKLNDFGKLLARQGDQDDVGSKRYRATVILLDDGWAVSNDGLPTR